MDIRIDAFTGVQKPPLAGGWMSYCRLATEQPATAAATKDKESKAEHDRGH